MRKNVLSLSGIAFGCLVGSGFAHADSLTAVTPDGDISGGEVIS